MKRCRTKDGRGGDGGKGGRGGRKRRRGEGRGVGEAHSARENVKTESIHKAEKLNVRGWR